MFSIEIEYINNVCFAANYYDRNSVEWPPHPDRVFQALVSSWGNKCDDSGAEALRWLELQDPPEILFPDVHYRPYFKNYVPISSNSEKFVNIISDKPVFDVKSFITRKERSFPAVILPDNNSKVYLVWHNSTPSQNISRSLSKLAKNVFRIGHSASFVRLAAHVDKDCTSDHRYINDENNGMKFFRCPNKGRFDSLIFSYDKNMRPDIALEYKYKEPINIPTQSVMGNDWIILSCKGDFVPTLESFPIVAKKLRDTIMSNIGNDIHEIISGHSSDDTPIQKPHLAIIPLANVGWKYSDGALLGLALILPRTSGHGTDERRQLKQAVAKFLGKNEEETKKDKIKRANLFFNDDLMLELDDAYDSRLSLSPNRYVTTSKTWASTSPIILDQHPKKNKSVEKIIANSCVHVGLPMPTNVKISRFSKIRGSPAAFTSRSKKGWESPKPKFLDNKFLCHAVITFEKEVCGPVVLGAGRYYGLGLCMKYQESDI